MQETRNFSAIFESSNTRHFGSLRINSDFREILRDKHTLQPAPPPLLPPNKSYYYLKSFELITFLLFISSAFSSFSSSFAEFSSSFLPLLPLCFFLFIYCYSYFPWSFFSSSSFSFSSYLSSSTIFFLLFPIAFSPPLPCICLSY